MDHKPAIMANASRPVKRLLVTALMFGLVAIAAPGGALSPAPAAASHSTLMTLRGTVTINGARQPGAKITQYFWTGSAWTISRTTTTDANGNYAIVAGRDHYFQLAAVKTVGTYCMPNGGFWQWSGTTSVFYTSPSWPNPTYINIVMSGGQIC